MDDAPTSASEAEVVAFPTRGEVFLDQRGESRAMRVAWHSDAGVVVMSLWQGDRCTGSFRLPVHDVPALVQTLVEGLAPRTSPQHRRVSNH